MPATAALSKDELLPINIDLHSAVTTVVGALPKILVYRDEAEKLNGFDITHFDQLELRTYALGHVHAKFLAASAPSHALATLVESATQLRDTLYHDAVALVLRGVISGDRIADFKTTAGYKGLALDLLGLLNLLRDSWDKIACRTGIQQSELKQAELLGQRLMEAALTREQASITVTQVQAQRQRNFTLFSRTYDQVRRAIGFLRWDHDDIDQICPSLFARRGCGRRK